MPLNNNQKMIQEPDSAAARMARLPIVRSAWSKLSVLYTVTKCSRPNLRILCDALENHAVHLCTVATDTFSPVMVILEPQISAANEMACKSLDWLESTFPLIQAPTEEIVAVAKDKMHEAKEMMSVVATGTKGCIQYRMEQAMNTMLHADSPLSPCMEKAVIVASAGLDHALNMSEALVDRMLPSTVEEKDSAERLDSTPLRTYRERLLSVSTKTYRGSYKAIATLSRPPYWARSLPTCLSSFISRLPQYLQHQAMIMILFLSQMYTLSCPSPQQTNTEDTPSTPAADSPSRNDWLTVIPWQESPTWQLRPPNSTDCECK